MATLNLTQLFVNLMADGSSVSAGSMDRAESSAIVGEVRTYGMGNRRGISVPGEEGTYKFTLAMISGADVTTLKSWKGQTIQVRNNLGQRFIGLIFAVESITPIKGENGFFTCQLTLNTISWTDGV